MARQSFNPTPEMEQILRQSGSLVKEESLGATAELAKALEIPLRKGVMSGDILDGIYRLLA